MRYRALGKSGLAVSQLSVGTVALGIQYGIRVPGHDSLPVVHDAIRVLQGAADAGVTLFDTAPGYGASERLLGLALEKHPDCLVATKVPVPRDESGQSLTGRELADHVERTVTQSLSALRRDVLDIVQIHNATLDVLARGEMQHTLERLRNRGDIRCVGASVYSPQEAMAVLDASGFEVLQVAYNLLDQRMSAEVLPRAHEKGIGVLNRSALLKGALTARANWLPPALATLRTAAERARDRLGQGDWHRLTEMALRFCLSSPFVDSLLVGVSSSAELDMARRAVEQPKLADDDYRAALRLSVDDERLVNPACWPAEVS